MAIPPRGMAVPEGGMAIPEGGMATRLRVAMTGAWHGNTLARRQDRPAGACKPSRAPKPKP